MNRYLTDNRFTITPRDLASIARTAIIVAGAAAVSAGAEEMLRLLADYDLGAWTQLVTVAIATVTKALDRYLRNTT